MSTVRTRTLLSVSTAVLLFLAGCVSANPRISEAEPVLLTRRAEIEKVQSRLLLETVERLAKRSADKSAHIQGQVTLDLLAMSGGGDYGAFGAGFLVGWGQAKDASSRRPDFDAVTGVSTGALLAAFAFLGTDQSYQAIEDFYRHPKKDWVKSRGLLFFLPARPSFMNIDGLEREIQQAVNADMVQALAAQASRGRCLLIAATNLDYGTQFFWDLGAEATKARETGEMDRIHRILLASAAIPAVFPPVAIDGSYYADGGVTANVLLRLDPDAPEGLIKLWKRKYPSLPLPRCRYWVIINNQLNQPPKTVQPKWPAVMAPSMSTSIRSATVAEVRWLAAQASYANEAYGADIEVRVVAIPDDWRAPVAGDFKRETMESLADLGRRLGAEPASWQLWAVPRNAPEKPAP